MVTEETMAGGPPVLFFGSSTGPMTKHAETTCTVFGRNSSFQAIREIAAVAARINIEPYTKAVLQIVRI
jgi:hypothetical protein